MEMVVDKGKSASLPPPPPHKKKKQYLKKFQTARLRLDYYIILEATPRGDRGPSFPHLLYTILTEKVLQLLLLSTFYWKEGFPFTYVHNKTASLF